MNFRFSLAMLAVLGLMTGCRASTALSYESCLYDTDCRSGGDRCITVIHNGATAHICSARCTFGGPACPTDRNGGFGSCVSFDSGATFQCYQTCTTGSTLCEYGSSCVTETGGGLSTNICLPGSGSTTVRAYAGCAAGMTCQAGTSCIGVKDGRTLDLCTVAHCGSDADCPRDSRGGVGACVSLDGDSFGTCVERCNTTSDCTYGSMGAERCTTHTAMGVTLPPPGVCLPT